jgi:hypothetical protein
MRSSFQNMVPSLRNYRTVARDVLVGVVDVDEGGIGLAEISHRDAVCGHLERAAVDRVHAAEAARLGDVRGADHPTDLRVVWGHARRGQGDLGLVSVLAMQSDDGAPLAAGRQQLGSGEAGQPGRQELLERELAGDDVVAEVEQPEEGCIGVAQQAFVVREGEAGRRHFRYRAELRLGPDPLGEVPADRAVHQQAGGDHQNEVPAGALHHPRRARLAGRMRHQESRPQQPERGKDKVGRGRGRRHPATADRVPNVANVHRATGNLAGTRTRRGCRARIGFWASFRRKGKHRSQIHGRGFAG